MINLDRAKLIFNTAKKDREQAKIFTTQACNAIKEACEQGETFVDLSDAIKNNDGSSAFYTSQESFVGPTLIYSRLTVAEKLAIDNLEELGFTCEFVVVDSYVPRGLQDDDGNGPTYRGWATIVKGWDQ